MSQFAFPRIHFAGDVIINVGTANNDDRFSRPLVNGARVMPVLDPRGGEAEFITQMTALPKSLRGGWNYYGDNEVAFDRATVASVQLGPGRVLKNDALVGAGVSMNAVMVDTNSQGHQGVQVFADEFSIRGKGVRCGGQPTPAYNRWTHYVRNFGAFNGPEGGGTIFQCAIPKDRLFRLRAGRSRALQSLHKALEKARGLTLRYAVYFVRLRLSEEQLAEQFARGEKVANPAIGRVVGTVAPWAEGELASVTLGRFLSSRDVSGQALAVKDMFVFGPAVAQVSQRRRVVSLDLANTFPETDDKLEKLDCGEVTLQVSDGQGLRPIGAVAYRRADYEATAGLVDVPYGDDLSEAIGAGRLVLTSDQFPAPLLMEVPHMVDSDHRCIYMHKGETRGIALQARHLGREPSAPFKVNVLYVRDTDAVSYFMTQAGFRLVADDVVKIVGPAQVVVRPGQPATVMVEAINPGAALVYFMPDGEPGANPKGLWDAYANIRVLPNDQYDHVPDEELTHGLVYEEVLRYYHLLHPAMSRVVDLSDAAQWTPPRAAALLERIDPAARERYGYMPRTRDLSDGKRRLLERWCRKIIRLNRPC
jgi:hypothetical protein